MCTCHNNIVIIQYMRYSYSVASYISSYLACSLRICIYACVCVTMHVFILEYNVYSYSVRACSYSYADIIARGEPAALLVSRKKSPNIKEKKRSGLRETTALQSILYAIAIASYLARNL